LLDHEHRAGVPETRYLKDVSHKGFNCTNGSSIKSGSLQKYIPNIGNAESISSSYFTVSDVHNIGILDLRIFNIDRNLENMLVSKRKMNLQEFYHLTPIDHAYSLPPTLEDASFDWLYWKQAKVPFSPDSLRYIAELDIEKDATILRTLSIDEGCINTMRISTLWLKVSAAAGLSLFEIAKAVCRPKPNMYSKLEKMVQATEELINRKNQENMDNGKNSQIDFFETLWKIFCATVEVPAEDNISSQMLSKKMRILV